VNNEFDASADIAECEEAFYSGNHIMLFYALYRCSLYAIPAPRWARYELQAGLHRYQNFEVKEFGEAFGISRPKGMNLNAEHKRVTSAFPLYQHIEDLRTQGKKVNEALFEEAGKRFHLGKTLAQEYYYDVKRVLGE